MSTAKRRARQVDDEVDGAARKRAKVTEATDDDDVTAIWAQIQAQEAASSSAPHPVESDEELARRLAAEWEAADGPQASSIPDTPQPSTSAPSKRVVANVADGDPLQSLSEHSDLFSQTRSCPKCKSDLPSPRGYVMFGSTNPPPSLLFILHVRCNRCSVSFCRGCFSEVKCAKTCKGASPDCPVLTCCANSRAIALFEALGYLDRNYLASKGQHIVNPAKSSSPFKGSHARGTTGKGGTGYATGSTGYSGGYVYSHSGALGRKVQPRTSSSDSLDAPDRSLSAIPGILKCLQLITTLLPNSTSEAIYDLLPSPSIRPLLQLSYLPEFLREVLHNDSVDEWVRQGDLYHAVLQLFQRLVDSELSIGILTQPSWDKKLSHGIDEFVWGTGELELDASSVSGSKAAPAPGAGRSPPLYTVLDKLVKQCAAFLAFSQGGQNGDDDEAENATVTAQAFCLALIEAHDSIKRVVAQLSPSEDISDPGASTSIGTSPNEKSKGKGKGGAKGKAPDPRIALERAYTASCERLCFAHVAIHDSDTEDGLDFPSHLFGKDLRSTANSTRIPKKRLHLIKELSVMSTGLPPGIWVRVDEVRNDALKIMIAGPEGTPYAGGLFEFDCFMPLNYPDESPKVLIHTTAGGRVRFNPNLYANGKVCLSLLGTWAGSPEEMWQPGKSTLLQVLISIQSMILIETPYYNEPGHGQADPTSPVNITYNKNVALQNVRWAMLDWMTEENRTGIWADVIAEHFTIRKDLIREQIQKWAAEDTRISSYHASSTVFCGTASISATMGYGMGMGMGVGMGMGGKRYGSSPQTGDLGSGMDLLDEFDKRVKDVERWVISRE